MQIANEVVGQDGSTLRSPDFFHPGLILKEEIEAREIAKKDFAALLNILPTHLSEVFSGKRPIGVKMARRLESALEISADFWLRMQNEYDLRLAETETDPVIVRIEQIVQLWQEGNAPLSKAIKAYTGELGKRAKAQQSESWVVRDSAYEKVAARSGQFASRAAAMKGAVKQKAKRK